MTADEARAALEILPKNLRTPASLRGMLRYEEQQTDGETCWPCECGRGTNKAWRCVQCLREMLAAVEAGR